jgi:hypothetical protein
MYLKPGFEEYLPDESKLGQAKVDALVNDFIAFRMFLEAETRDRVPDPDRESLFKTTTKERNRRLRTKQNSEALLRRGERTASLLRQGNKKGLHSQSCCYWGKRNAPTNLYQ